MGTATTSTAGQNAHAAHAARMAEASAKAAARSANELNDPGTVGAAPLETIPDPPAAAKLSRPTTLADAAPWLLKPFYQRDIEIKISATNRDKTKGLASPYADMRVYFVRLDHICGVENWSHTITLSERGAVCALTIFGVTKSAAGDYPPVGDTNPATSAEAQAFKRACAAFGLGRYLYSFGDTWAALEQDGKRFVDPAKVVAAMYASLPRGDES